MVGGGEGEGRGREESERKTMLLTLHPPLLCSLGRHRWVVYANLDWLTGQDPGKIPGEWHGWLHQITDETPVTHPATFAAPPYALPYRGYASGTPARYQPKGAWNNPQRRNWRKVETWEPPAA